MSDEKDPLRKITFMLRLEKYTILENYINNESLIYRNKTEFLKDAIDRLLYSKALISSDNIDSFFTKKYIRELEGNLTPLKPTDDDLKKLAVTQELLQEIAENKNFSSDLKKGLAKILSQNDSAAQIARELAGFLNELSDHKTGVSSLIDTRVELALEKIDEINQLYAKADEQLKLAKRMTQDGQKAFIGAMVDLMKATKHGDIDEKYLSKLAAEVVKQFEK